MNNNNAITPFCPVHRHQLATMPCTECGAPMCAHCDRYEINTRPWCLECGKAHASTVVGAAAKLFAKVLAVMALWFVARMFHLPPLWAAVAAVAAAFSLFWPRTMQVVQIRGGKVVGYV